MSKEYLNDADKFLDGGAEKGVVRTCRNCASYDAKVWQCNDIRSENNRYMCNPDTPGCWFHCTMADLVKVKVKLSILREKQRLANMTATDKRIEALETTKDELLVLLKDINDELSASSRDAMETGNREGSSLPARLHMRIAETIKKAKWQPWEVTE